MRKKIIDILVCIMLIMTTILIIVPEDLKVKAVLEESNNNGEFIGLDFQYVKNITLKLSEVNLKPEVYEEEELKKGRSFGSKL